MGTIGTQMKYLLSAYNLAEERGYLRYPEVRALQEEVPTWFHLLGTREGASAFETRHGVRLPAALHEFYGCLPLACFFEASGDGEVFLREMAEGFVNPDFPPIVEWSSGRYLVVGFHGHSGCVCAAGLGADDPPAVWGFLDDGDAFDRAAATFSEWLFRMVDGYERQLDYWPDL
jgi:hypothetical protein